MARRDLIVRDGTLEFAGRRYRCAIGCGGIVSDKHEGDGGTPVGRFPLRRVYYRPDRIATPAILLPVLALEPDDGWCDDPADPAYNQPVRLPFAASHERLWRDDELYDLIVVVGHNDDPVVPGAGSAIFLHVARRDYSPTEGCVALAREDLAELLGMLGPDCDLVIAPAD
ncbi:L,D-transpeptidase family protein [Oceanibacterium hippocampi]|uniref:L,D-transpeptidase catalytic domain n=1 Tax=Oceanibacterium hippocampi TaxID=745714 RepID=A0A1Y5RLB4_9PROT|nr:L,D-transpeptidase family protein [Oceanibacterium hippocampi]SLN20239.1 L,D-transpeptidase catalytic domain [Oceanibacterium hippocampi]